MDQTWKSRFTRRGMLALAAGGTLLAALGGCENGGRITKTEILLDNSDSVDAKSGQAAFLEEYLGVWADGAETNDTLTVWTFADRESGGVEPLYDLKLPTLDVPTNVSRQKLIAQELPVIRKRLEAVRLLRQSPILEAVGQLCDLRSDGPFRLIVVSDLMQTSPGKAPHPVTFDETGLRKDDAALQKAMEAAAPTFTRKSAPREVAIHWYYGTRDRTTVISPKEHERVRTLFTEFFQARGVKPKLTALDTKAPTAVSAAP